MDRAGYADTDISLEAKLAARSSRVAELEARVSLLEAENARLREPKGEAPGLTGEEAPGAQKQTAAEKPGEAAGCCNVSLEDDDVSVMPLRKKRSAARVVTSDSEDDDTDDCDLGSSKDDDGDDQEGVITRSRKRALHQVSDSENEDVNQTVDVPGSKSASRLAVTDMESEDEDDRIPIGKVLKRIRKEMVSDKGESGDAQGSSTPTTRRSARLVKKRQAAPRVLNFVEPKEYEGSEDDMEEDDDMDDFINDGDSSEDASDSAEVSCAEPELPGASAVNEESSPEPEESDSVIDYKNVMACIGRKKKDRDWILEGDMLAAFRENPELCLKAVCALYRKQTEDEQLEKSALIHNRQGFSLIHATRGSFIAEFLLDGDPHGPLKKTVDDLKACDCSALGFCQMVASHYSKQLFAIYQNKEDPYFHP